MKKILITLLKAVIFFLGFAVLGGLIDIPSNNPAIWRFFAELIPLAVVVILSIVFWLVEKKSIIIFSRKNMLGGSVLGISIGICWLGLAVGIMYLLGIITFTGSSSVSYLWLWIVSAFLNVIMQELLVRGYLYQMIKSNYGIIVSTVISTILFTVMHGGAFEAGIVPILNVVTMSVFMTVMMEYTGSLISSICVHSIWNISGALILGGVSLADNYPHLLNTEFSGNALLSGGSCKIEGSIIVLILNLLLCGIFTVLLLKEKQNPAKV